VRFGEETDEVGGQGPGEKSCASGAQGGEGREEEGGKGWGEESACKQVLMGE
jgi:hypothetical protein